MDDNNGDKIKDSLDVIVNDVTTLKKTATCPLNEIIFDLDQRIAGIEKRARKIYIHAVVSFIYHVIYPLALLFIIYILYKLT